MESKVVYRDGMAFDVHLDGHTFPIDADPSFGGHNLGPKPKGLVLSALLGCTGMDVISMLKKMRNEPASFEVTATTELTDEHPKVFKDVTLKYLFTGDGLNLKKLRKAVRLSNERYCGVHAMLSKATTIHSEIWINGEQVPLENDE